MNGYDNHGRRQLCREHVQLLASEMRRARGPRPAEQADDAGRSSWGSRLLAHARPLRRGRPSRAPAYRL
jgi:hypothetical protein